MSYRIGRVIGSKGPSFRAHSTSKPDELRDTSGIDVGARRNYDHEQAAVKKAENDKKKREDLIKQRNKEAERRMKDTMREEMDSKGTEARVKIKNVSRPDDPEPTSADSKLSKTGQIKTKIIDEEKPLMSDKTLGLPSGLIAAARAVMEKKHDSDDDDARKMKGGKTKVDLEPETDDDVRDDSEKKMKKTVKEATHPKTEKEKKLAALAHPKDKITHKDVLVGRGVLAKEEVDLESLTEEELEEVLKKSDPAGKWIKDFVHSDDPKFAGKSKKKRMQMALGAYYAKQRNEEVEINEKMSEFEKLAARRAWQKNPANKGKPLPTHLQTDQQKQKAAAKSANMKIMTKEEVEIEEATKSASYNALMADPLKNRLERLKQKEKSMAPGISAERKKLAIEKDKIQKQLANKQRNEEVEIDEAAGKSKASAPVVTKKIDFQKVKQVRDARKAAKQARHQDTSHLPPGWKTTWNRNEETDMELTDKELERLNEIAAQLDEIDIKTVNSYLAQTKGDEKREKGRALALKKKWGGRVSGTEAPKVPVKEEVELDEKITPSELRAQLKAKAAAKKANDSETKSTTVNESAKTHHQLMASYHERMASAKDVSDSDKEMHEKAFQQHRKASVKPEAYSSSANKMTKALLKEEVELDEAKRGRPRKNPAPDQKSGEDEEHEHIIMQLRKVVSTHGALPVKHLDGKSTKLTPQLAQHALNKHNAMKTADQKQDFEQKLHKSHDSMRAALGG